MNSTQNQKPTEVKSFRPLLQKDHGFYHSANLTTAVSEAYRACQEKSNIDRILQDLPDTVENFLDLVPVKAEMMSEDEYQVVWENQKSAKVQGTLTLLLGPSRGRPGTWITAQANFEKLNFKSDGSSTLMNVFLKRLKALIETGEVPTTKGQPSGREEISPEQNQKLH